MKILKKGVWFITSILIMIGVIYSFYPSPYQVYLQNFVGFYEILLYITIIAGSIRVTYWAYLIGTYEETNEKTEDIKSIIETFSKIYSKKKLNILRSNISLLINFSMVLFLMVMGDYSLTFVYLIFGLLTIIIRSLNKKLNMLKDKNV